MKGHTARFWFSENVQAYADWLTVRDKILSCNPMELRSGKHPEVALSSANSTNSADRPKPQFGDGRQDYMMQRYKNLALISISGSLVKSDSPWNRYYGVVSYDEIRRSVMMALNDPSVDGILAVMSTPGGAATGADAMASFFSRANKVKPFYAFAETDMCSGGYYLGAPAREIFAQRAALVGSIGVIMVHMDYLDMYKEAGINPTVFRAGEFKALGSPYEHLDKKAQANISKSLGNYFNMFNEHVVENRSYDSVEQMRETAGEGRVFMAEEAMEVGLVDQVAELEDCLEIVSDKSRKASGRSTSLYHMPKRGNTMKVKGKDGKLITLSEEVVAALAAGADPASFGLTAEQLANAVEDEEAAAGDKPEAKVEGDKPEAKVEGDKPEAKVEDDKPEAKVEAAPSTGEGSLAGEISALVKQAASMATEIAQLKVDLRLANEKLSTAAAATEAATKERDALMMVARQAVSWRQTALGYQPSVSESLSAAELVDTFEKLDATFKERFKPGQKSVSTAPATGAELPNNPQVTAARSMTGKL